jgi:hypothetical protein
VSCFFREKRGGSPLRVTSAHVVGRHLAIPRTQARLACTSVPSKGSSGPAKGGLATGSTRVSGRLGSKDLRERSRRFRHRAFARWSLSCWLAALRIFDPNGLRRWCGHGLHGSCCHIPNRMFASTPKGWLERWFGPASETSGSPVRARGLIRLQKSSNIVRPIMSVSEELAEPLAGLAAH